MSTLTSKFSSTPKYDHDHFEQLYRTHADPWSVLTSSYERAKYQASLDALGKPCYRHILELGCSIGALTRLLAPRCGRLTALDTSAGALQRAREHGSSPHVRFVQAHLPDHAFGGSFDLVVLSEVLYYFSEHALGRLARRLSPAITPATEFLVVHWTRETDYPLTGDRAMDIFRQQLDARILHSRREPCYRLETWWHARGAARPVTA